MIRSLVALLFLSACSTPPQITAKVVDVWEKPIAQATVIQEGVTDRFTTDASGQVTFETTAGTARLMGGADGHIKDLQTVTLGEEDESASVTLTLFPEADSTGFHAIGPKGPYMALEHAPLETVATEMTAYHGIKNAPKTLLTGKKAQRFVLRSELRPEDLSRFDLQLTKLKHLDSTTSTGVLGEVEIDLNLWVADAEIEYEVKGMQSRDHYLLTTTKPLESGVYAFHAQEILSDEGTDTIDKLPEEMRVIYPFEVN